MTTLDYVLAAQVRTIGEVDTAITALNVAAVFEVNVTAPLSRLKKLQEQFKSGEYVLVERSPAGALVTFHTENVAETGQPHDDWTGIANLAVNLDLPVVLGGTLPDGVAARLMNRLRSAGVVAVPYAGD